MVLLADTPFKSGRGEAYVRCMGNHHLAKILSRVQSVIIKSGIDLEKRILAEVKTIDDLDDYLSNGEDGGISVASKGVIKKSTTIQFDGDEPDFMVFDTKGKAKACHIIELKDGCEYDTKAAGGETGAIDRFISENAKNIPYTFKGWICCFNVESKADVVKGFKLKIGEESALTGREFCELLEIDYDAIVKARAGDRAANLDYFLNYLVKDDKIRGVLTGALKAAGA